MWLQGFSETRSWNSLLPGWKECFCGSSRWKLNTRFCFTAWNNDINSWPVLLFLTRSEEEDRDLNCVASSLVQLMLDPHYRSLAGFQSLVQKEWVMAGHRFLDRCNHLKKNDKEEVFVWCEEAKCQNKQICHGTHFCFIFPPPLFPFLV